MFVALEPWAWGPVVEMGLLDPEIYLLILTSHMWWWEQPVL